jgi:hypothetical protein
MGSRFVLSLGMAGLALATAVAPRAEAQAANPVTVCRNGARMNSNDSRICDGRGGVDLRSTAIARRDENARAQNARDAAARAQNTGRNGDDRYGRNGDDRSGRNGDDRYGRNDRNNGRWNDRGSNNGRYGNSARQVYQWQGLVDREIRIQLQGSRAYIQPMGNNETRTGRGQMLSGLPQQEGSLRVETLEGRGQVDVIQQPNASNNYTATLRVRDPSSGASNYRLAVYWQPAYSNNGRFGRN